MSFDPSEERALAVAARMQTRLADSLRYIAGAVGESLGFDPWSLDDVLAMPATSAVSPQLFGAYYDLVLALNGGENDRAILLLQEIAAARPLDTTPVIFDLADPARDPHADRYRRLVDTDASTPLVLAPPRAREADRLRALIAEAFALTEAGNPSLAREMRVLLRELVLAAGDGFDGVSSFMLWGGAVLNVARHTTVLETAQALAHESGHNLLFGLCADGPLHENDDRERFPSPLRADKRPMDGVIHATYVAARMHQAVERLRAAGVLDENQREEAATVNDENARYFYSGFETVTAHAKLTPLGRAVLGEAEAYMAAYRP